MRRVVAYNHITFDTILIRNASGEKCNLSMGPMGTLYQSHLVVSERSSLQNRFEAQQIFSQFCFLGCQNVLTMHF